MGSEKGPEFYNTQLGRVSLPLETSPWKDLYEMVSLLMPPPESDPKIVDVGCGTGRFAKLLQLKGYKEYWGVDFSSIRITEAQKYVKDFEFTTSDIFHNSVREKLLRFNCFIFIDVLEHLTYDREFISYLPLGSNVIIALPNFDSEGHVRYFENSEQILMRYNGLLRFDNNSIVENIRKEQKNRIKKIFVLAAVKV